MRRLLVDMTRMQVPSVPVQRVMHLAPVVAARRGCTPRPAWTAIFARAYALVAAETPILRRAYVKLPTPRLYEYPESSASIAVERDDDGEPIVLMMRVIRPETMGIEQIDAAVRHAKTAPLREVKDFRSLLAIGRVPLPLRRLAIWTGMNIGRIRGNFVGTFGISVYSALGAESLHPLSPMTVLLNYGIIGDDGVVPVRMIYDHRVFDGAMVARVLEMLETTLTTGIVDELERLATRP
jgi:hypothetical protein